MLKYEQSLRMSSAFTVPYTQMLLSIQDGEYNECTDEAVEIRGVIDARTDAIDMSDVFMRVLSDMIRCANVDMENVEAVHDVFCELLNIIFDKKYILIDSDYLLCILMYKASDKYSEKYIYSEKLFSFVETVRNDMLQLFILQGLMVMVSLMAPGDKRYAELARKVISSIRERPQVQREAAAALGLVFLQ